MIDAARAPPGGGQGRRGPDRRRRRLAGVRHAEQRLVRLRRAAARRVRRGHAVGRRVDRPGRGRPALRHGPDGADGSEPTDPHPQVISVRQRRDYRVPSVAALLRVAEAARRSAVPEDEEAGPVESVGEAVLELLQAGDGSLASLDIPELEPLDGLRHGQRGRRPARPRGVRRGRRRRARSPRPPTTCWSAASTSTRSRGRRRPRRSRPLRGTTTSTERTGRPRRSRRSGWTGAVASWRSVRTGRAGVCCCTRRRSITCRVPSREELHPGQLPAGELRLDRQLRRGGQPVDIRWQPQRRVLVVHAS